MNCRDTGRFVEALAALLWREALQCAAPALPHGAVLFTPWGTTRASPCRSFRAGTVRAAFGTSISCVYFWKLQGGVLGRVSVSPTLSSGPSGGSRAESLSSPSTQEAQAALSLQPSPIFTAHHPDLRFCQHATLPLTPPQSL